MSAYIEAADYKHRISDKRLNMILEEDLNLLADAEETAIATIRDYLYPYYDVDVIFAKSGSARDKQVMRWVINLVMYYIYERIPDKLVPERVVKNYDDTLILLMEVSDGKKSLNLERLEDPDNPDGYTTATKFRWGGQTRRYQR